MGPAVDLKRPGVGHKIVAHVFCIHAKFDGVTLELEVLLTVAQGFAAGNANLFFDEVQARNLLGYRMLDLQPRVHF